VIQLRADEQRAFAQYIYSACAITLDDSKHYLIEGRLQSLLEETRAPSFSELLRRAQTDGSGGIKRKIVDLITTGETLFFRDTAPFDLLRHKLIPDLVDRRQRTNPRGQIPIRIWSAACSTGQEVYSIAIVLHELLRDTSRYNFRLVGTDISSRAVARASKATYSRLEVSRGLSEAMLSRYFVNRGDEFQIRDEVRALATFRSLNLMEDFSALGKFDIIFCRNVAIYFNDTDRANLFQRLARSLEPDGALLLGSMESLSALCPQLEAKRHLRSVFYTLRSGAM
jgi:chemotaxis protein methyltransferase CheR